MTRRRGERIFALLVALFPRAFREAFGVEMRQVFAAQRERARAGGPRAVLALWMRTAAGMTAAAWQERRGTPGDRARLLQWADLRYTVRRLAATPGFSAAVAGTLAICIGANLTIFAAVDSILLRPLPFPDAGRLVTVYNTYPAAGVMDDGASIANYYERRGRIAAFAAVALYRDDAVIVGEAGRSEREFVMRVTPDFFATLGVAPMIGRTFTEAETVYGADRAVILSEPYWRQRYGGDPAVTHRTIRINGSAYAIAGVLPAGFRFLSSKARLFLPLASGADDRDSSRRHSGSSSHMVARLSPGATRAEAQAQVDAQNAALERGDPQRAMIADAGFRSRVEPLHARHVAAIRPALLLLQAGAGVLLIIGLVNVGNLFLIRAGTRARELAVRRAIGARPSHIAAAVLAETLLLSAAGSACGVAIAAAGIRLLATLGAARLPLGSQIALSGVSIGAAAASAISIGVVLGVAIAAHHLRNQAGDTLRSGSRGNSAGPRAQRVRQAILAAQIALSLTLLSAAVLLSAGVVRLTHTSPGFASARLLTAQVSLPWARYPSDASLQSFVDRVTAGLRASPGVAAAGIATNIPLSGNGMKSAATIAGRPLRPGEIPHGVYAYAVGGAYFEAMGIPLREGRYLTASDSGPSARACVVDEDFARRYWPSGGAIGRRLFLGSSEGAPDEAYTVAGVVAPVKQAALSETDRTGAVYYPYSSRFDRAIYLVIRTTVEPDAVQSAVRAVVARADPEIAVNNARAMDVRIADSLIVHRSPAIFGAVFSAVALLLVALGTYGALSYAVSQRHREIGVRLALGARPGQVRGQVLRAGLQVAAMGMALGLAGAWAAGKTLASVLADVPQAPAAAIATATAIMASVCLAAAVFPARRAARISPLDAMRD